MAAVQLMCARLGMVTGRGLGRRDSFALPAMGAVVHLRLADGCECIQYRRRPGRHGRIDGDGDRRSVVFMDACFCAVDYRPSLQNFVPKDGAVFKWLTLVLFAYVITAFLAKPDWPAVTRATFVPHIEWTRSYLSVLVAILGTTISPYLFFWQAAQEVEAERERGRRDACAAARRNRPGIAFSNGATWLRECSSRTW